MNKTWVSEDGFLLDDMRNHVNTCLSDREGHRGQTSADIWFVGDSRVRHMYESSVALVKNLPMPSEIKPRTNHSVSVSRDTNMRYICDNYLTESFENHLHSLSKGNSARIPDFVFVSVAQWFMSSLKWKEMKLNVRNHAEARSFYKRTLSKMRPLMEQVTALRRTKFIWILQDYVNDIMLKQKGYFAIGSNNKNTKLYNAIAELVFSNSSIHVLKSAREITHALNDFRDGLHVGIRSCAAKANLLFNIICHPPNQPVKPTENLDKPTNL